MGALLLCAVARLLVVPSSEAAPLSRFPSALRAHAPAVSRGRTGTGGTPR